MAKYGGMYINRKNACHVPNTYRDWKNNRSITVPILKRGIKTIQNLWGTSLLSPVLKMLE